MSDSTIHSYLGPCKGTYETVFIFFFYQNMILFSVGNYCYGKLKVVVLILILGDSGAVGRFQVRTGEQEALLEIDSNFLGLR